MINEGLISSKLRRTPASPKITPRRTPLVADPPGLFVQRFLPRGIPDKLDADVQSHLANITHFRKLPPQSQEPCREIFAHAVHSHTRPTRHGHCGPNEPVPAPVGGREAYL